MLIPHLMQRCVWPFVHFQLMHFLYLNGKEKTTPCFADIISYHQVCRRLKLLTHQMSHPGPSATHCVAVCTPLNLINLTPGGKSALHLTQAQTQGGDGGARPWAMKTLLNGSCIFVNGFVAP